MVYKSKGNPECHTKKLCRFRKDGACTILNSTYFPGKSCPFRKPPETVKRKPVRHDMENILILMKGPKK